MSGIFGIYNRNGQPVIKESLKAMSDSIKYRGPDSQKTWSDSSIGFGHNMLHTTPESLHEKLPLTKHGLTITCDVRLDNRSELTRLLNIESHSEIITDSLLILLSYMKWGADCVHYLLGDFAFAIWDKNNQKLFCVRDHMGVKPFVYHHSKKQFVFASEVDAILKVPEVPHIYNEMRIGDFLADLEGIDLTSTFYEQISRLPPAHYMIVTQKKISTNHYWDLGKTKNIKFKSDDDYISAFNEIYSDAVNQRLRAISAASMLSGGIDSGSIVSIAKELHSSKTSSPFPVFSAVSRNENDCIETHCINQVINQGGLDVNRIFIEDLNELNDDINRIIQSLREPFDLMTLIIGVYLLAARSGYRIMLDGVEGDIPASLSLSYPSYLIRDGEYKLAYREIKGMQDNYYYRNCRSIARIYFQHLISAFTPSIAKHFKRKYYNNFFLQYDINNLLISKSFAQTSNLLERFENHQQLYGIGLHSSLKEFHINSIVHPNLYVALERYDRVAALCGIEPRHPLLDKRNIEFLVSIPWDQKVRYGWNKFLLRKSYSKTLPKEVCWRKGKEHLGWQCTKSWLELNQKEIFNYLETNQDLLKKYIDSKKLEAILKNTNLKETNDNSINSLIQSYILTQFVG